MGYSMMSYNIETIWKEDYNFREWESKYFSCFINCKSAWHCYPEKRKEIFHIHFRVSCQTISSELLLQDHGWMFQTAPAPCEPQCLRM